MALTDLENDKKLSFDDYWSDLTASEGGADKIINADDGNGATGDLIEDFIKRNLITSVTYSGEHLSLQNNDGEEVCSAEVTVQTPEYSHEFLILKIVDQDGNNINGDYYSNDLKIYAVIQFDTSYVLGDKTYYSKLKQNLTLNILNYSILQEITSNNYTSTSSETTQNTKIEITDIINKLTPNQLSNFSIRGTINVREGSDTVNLSSTLASLSLIKYILSSSILYTDDNKFKIDIQGLASTKDVSLEYYEYNVRTEELLLKTVALSETSSVTINFDNCGIYQVLARLKTGTTTFKYSEWFQFNTVAGKGATIALANACNIQTSIRNCGADKLFDFAYISGLGGTVGFEVYTSSIYFDVDNISNATKNEYSITLLSGDDSNYTAFKLFNELTLVDEGSKVFMYIKVKIGSESYDLVNLYYDDDLKNASYDKIFELDLTQLSENTNNQFNYTEGAVLNFSQITSFNNNVFTDLNSESSYSQELEDEYSKYLIPAQGKTNLETGEVTPINLFTSEKDLSSLLDSSQGFTLEFELKNSNITGDSPCITIGNLQLGPGYARCYSSNQDDDSIYINSRADYEKEEITHILIVRKKNYKPSTYNKIYDELFSGYSSMSDGGYDILKIYVNGTINREIMISDTDLKKDGKFALQIAPVDSDLNLYILRTYDKAFTYDQVRKNRLSSMMDIDEKIKYFNENDILADDGTISFYKALQKHNVFVLIIPYGEQPLWFGNKDTTGSGEDPYLTTSRAALIHYKNSEDGYSGRFTEFEYKAQGSSAKKYLLAHNCQYKLGSFVSECQISKDDDTRGQVITEKIELVLNPETNKLEDKTVAVVNEITGETGTSSYYKMKSANDDILIQKLVGKVNTASSMQSHKIGATKLYLNAYKEYMSGTYDQHMWQGGRKCVYEDQFLFFYYILTEAETANINNIQIEDLYTDYGDYVDDSRVNFFGFFTFGSGKADNNTIGRDKTYTPEYLMMEGADNASPGANFHQPWAAFLTFQTSKDTCTINASTAKTDSSYWIQQTKDVTLENHTKGLLIDDETIKFEIASYSDDPLDIDVGAKENDEFNKNNKTFKFASEVSSGTLPYFVGFYNCMYEFDYTNLQPWTGDFNVTLVTDSEGKISSTETRDINKKYYFPSASTKIINSDGSTTTAAKWDVYRYDKLRKIFVPAGLHYSNGAWETYNLATRINQFANKNTDTIAEPHVRDFINGVSINTVNTNTTNISILQTRLRTLWKAAVEYYVDVDDLAFHQGFIRVVSGTDNRAKNTYFYIVGKRYTDKTETLEDGTIKTYYKLKFVYGGKEGNNYQNNSETSLSGYKLSSDSDYFYFSDTTDEISLDIITELCGEGNTKVKLSTKLDSWDDTYNKTLKAKNISKLIKPVTVKTDTGDYKIRFFQDDIDTIFATDNNGQQLKKYDLLEPPFDTTTESRWGDKHSSLFYPFDINYEDKILEAQSSIVNYLLNNGEVGDTTNNLYKLFLSVQKTYPSIAYNHMGEIYYESAQSFFQDGSVTDLVSTKFPSLGSFANNNVKNPLSLSHGSCIESETQFLKDRLLLLASSLNLNKLLNPVANIGGSSGGGSSTLDININAQYYNKFSPNLYSMPSNGTAKIDHLITETDPTRVSYNTDVIPSSEFPKILSHMSIPDLEYQIEVGGESLQTLQLINADKYKSVEIISGVSNFITFPNVVKYHITDSSFAPKNTSYSMSTIMPSVEDCKIVGTIDSTSETTVDFRGCTKLAQLDLSEFNNISTLIIPESNKLVSLKIPNVNTLALDYYKNLEEFIAPDDLSIKSLTLDCRNYLVNNTLFNTVLDKCDLVELLSLTNIPNNFVLSLEQLDKLCLANQLKIEGDSVNIYIGTSTTKLSAISLTLKAALAKFLGNIDDPKNKIIVHYNKITPTSIFISPNDLQLGYNETYSNFDISLKGTGGLDANDVELIEYEGNWIPKLTYTSDLTVNQYTGEIIAGNTASYTSYVTVALTDNPSISATCNIIVGFRVPEKGDFVYNDGTISPNFRNWDEAVGIVFAVNNISDESYYDVRVLALDTLTWYNSNDSNYYNYTFGPSSAGKDYKNSQGNYTSLSSAESLLYSYIKEISSSITGLSEKLIYTPHYVSQVGTYQYPSNPYGIFYSAEATEPIGDYVSRSEAQSGKSINEATISVAEKIWKYHDSDVTLTSNNIQSIETKILQSFKNKYSVELDSEDYIKALAYEGFVAAYDYEPNLLSSENSTHSNILNQLCKHNWYIPSSQELDILIYDKVYALCADSTTTYAAYSNYWKDTNRAYYKGNNTFGKIASKIDSTSSKSVGGLQDHIPFLKFTQFVSCLTANELAITNDSKISSLGNMTYCFTGIWGTTDGTSNTPYSVSGTNYASRIFRDSRLNIAPICQLRVNYEN